MRALSAWVGVLLLLSGCAHSSAPKDWLPRAVEAAEEANGGWILLRLEDDSKHEGELIAVGADSLFVLEPDGCRGYGHAQIEHAVLTGYDSQAGRIAGWAVMGAISTVSHGYGLVITLPLWVLVGTVESISQSTAGRIEVTKTSWEQARKYARFPQGLPEGLDRAALLPRNPPPRPVKPVHQR